MFTVLLTLATVTGDPTVRKDYRFLEHIDCILLFEEFLGGFQVIALQNRID